jgi:AraC-like DNA-binding protein
VKYRNSRKVELPFHYGTHHDYEIYFFHEGNCTYLIHNQLYDLKPGDIILMDGWIVDKPNVSSSSEYIRSVIQFSPHWIKSVLMTMGCMYLLETFQRLHHCLIRTNENQESKELERVYIRLAELSRSADLRDIRIVTEIKILLLQALMIVHKLGQMNSIHVPNKKEEKALYAENIVNYIEHHFMNKLTLQSIAKDLNLSRSYVAYVLKTKTGYTVMEYVMECRLNHAKYLLEMEPLKPIKDVAYESGFESAAHFSRYFREKVGVTAKEYRQIRLGKLELQQT